MNDIQNNTINSNGILIKDYLTFDNEDEFLKRFYKQSELQNKLKQLGQYYKYHSDIGRLFMEPFYKVLITFYDKKRKIQYFELIKIIDKQNKMNPSQTPKAIACDPPSKSSFSSQSDSNSSCGKSEKERRLVELKKKPILADITKTDFS